MKNDVCNYSSQIRNSQNCIIYLLHFKENVIFHTVHLTFLYSSFHSKSPTLNISTNPLYGYKPNLVPFCLLIITCPLSYTFPYIFVYNIQFFYLPKNMGIERNNSHHLSINYIEIYLRTTQLDFPSLVKYLLLCFSYRTLVTHLSHLCLLPSHLYPHFFLGQF